PLSPPEETKKKTSEAKGAKLTTTSPVSRQAWYYRLENQIIEDGPVSSAELKRLAAIGLLSPAHLIWRKGMAKWKHASSIKGLFPAVAPRPAPSGKPTPPAHLPSGIESTNGVKGEQPPMQ